MTQTLENPSSAPTIGGDDGRPSASMTAAPAGATSTLTPANTTPQASDTIMSDSSPLTDLDLLENNMDVDTDAVADSPSPAGSAKTNGKRPLEVDTRKAAKKLKTMHDWKNYRQLATIITKVPKWEGVKLKHGDNFDLHLAKFQTFIKQHNGVSEEQTCTAWLSSLEADLANKILSKRNPKDRATHTYDAMIKFSSLLFNNNKSESSDCTYWRGKAMTLRQSTESPATFAAKVAGVRAAYFASPACTALDLTGANALHDQQYDSMEELFQSVLVFNSHSTVKDLLISYDREKSNGQKLPFDKNPFSDLIIFIEQVIEPEWSNQKMKTPSSSSSTPKILCRYDGKCTRNGCTFRHTTAKKTSHRLPSPPSSSNKTPVKKTCKVHTNANHSDSECRVQNPQSNKKTE